MAQVQASSSDVKQQVHEVARKASPWIETAARFGYVAKGIVYIVMGFIAVVTAMGFRDKAAGTRGTLATLAAAPLGRPLLIALAVGLSGYALFKLLSGLLDGEEEGTDLKGIGRRIGDVISGCIQAFLAYLAIRLAFGLPEKGDEQSSQESAATVMSQPFGPAMLMVAGGVIVAIGVYQAFVGVKGTFAKSLCVTDMSDSCRFWTTLLGRAGHLALGVVLALVGGFVFNAGRDLNPRESRGVTGALEAVDRHPMGAWLLISIAVGLVMYGAFMFLKARYRPINVVPGPEGSAEGAR